MNKLYKVSLCDCVFTWYDFPEGPGQVVILFYSRSSVNTFPAGTPCLINVCLNAFKKT